MADSSGSCTHKFQACGLRGSDNRPFYAPVYILPTHRSNDRGQPQCAWSCNSAGLGKPDLVTLCRLPLGGSLGSVRRHARWSLWEFLEFLAVAGDGFFQLCLLIGSCFFFLREYGLPFLVTLFVLVQSNVATLILFTEFLRVFGREKGRLGGSRFRVVDTLDNAVFPVLAALVALDGLEIRGHQTVIIGATMRARGFLCSLLPRESF